MVGEHDAGGRAGAGRRGLFGLQQRQAQRAGTAQVETAQPVALQEGGPVRAGGDAAGDVRGDPAVHDQPRRTRPGERRTQHRLPVEHRLPRRLEPSRVQRPAPHPHHLLHMPPGSRPSLSPGIEGRLLRGGREHTRDGSGGGAGELFQDVLEQGGEGGGRGGEGEGGGAGGSVVSGDAEGTVRPGGAGGPSDTGAKPPGAAEGAAEGAVRPVAAAASADGGRSGTPAVAEGAVEAAARSAAAGGGVAAGGRGKSAGIVRAAPAVDVDGTEGPPVPGAPFAATWPAAAEVPAGRAGGRSRVKCSRPLVIRACAWRQWVRGCGMPGTG